jgi:hypothetical protein
VVDVINNTISLNGGQGVRLSVINTAQMFAFVDFNHRTSWSDHAGRHRNLCRRSRSDPGFVPVTWGKLPARPPKLAASATTPQSFSLSDGPSK